MNQSVAALSPQALAGRIVVIRGQRVLLDGDLAQLYEVETRVFNQAVKRNLKRFPKDFMFQLTADEFENLISQSVTSTWGVPPEAGKNVNKLNEVNKNNQLI